MKNRKKIMIPILSVIIFAVLVVAVIIIRKNTPNKEHMSLTDYFDVEDGQVQLILEDESYETPGLLENDHLYVDYDLVHDVFNSRFYWDKNENLLLYTTSTAVISAEIGSKDVYKNKSKESMDYTVVKMSGETVYVALEYVQKYSAIDFSVYDSPNRAVITYQYGEDNEKTCINVKKDTALRYEPNIKSEILVDLKKDDKLRFLEEEKNITYQEEGDTGFCKVMTETGVSGYAKVEDLNQSYTEITETDFQEETYSHILLDEKVNLVWHQVTTAAANSNILTLLDAAKGVNVVSPTWFKTSDNKGNISSIADYTYVERAHRAGVQVWALCDDFSPDMKIGKVLGKTSRRQRLEKNLIAEAIRYSLDGINIDFENVKEESGDDFIQFIRELGIMCRNNGIILSIDNYPPMSFNMYYNRGEQAAVADYVITMAYDEYYSGSEEAGPVSSISYVENGTTNTLAEVPAEQTIIALPFYSRLWKETTSGGKVKLSSETYSMSYAAEIVSDAGATSNWDKETGLDYAEYKSGKSIYKIWIENEKSLELKLKTVSEANTAGVAFWKLGLEKSTVWDTVAKYVN